MKGFFAGLATLLYTGSRIFAAAFNRAEDHCLTLKGSTANITLFATDVGFVDFNRVPLK